MSSEDLYFCFSSDCKAKSTLGSLEDLRVHRQKVGIKHKAIKLTKTIEKHNLFQTRVKVVISPLKQLQKEIEKCCDKLIDGIKQTKSQICKEIDEQYQKYYTTKVHPKNVYKNIEEFKCNNFGNITCEQMASILQVFDAVGKDSKFQQEQKTNIQRLDSELKHKFKKQIKVLLQGEQILSSLFKADKSPTTLSIFQSAISNKSDESNNIEDSLLRQLEKNDSVEEKRPSRKTYKKMEQEYQKSISIEQDSKDFGNIYQKPFTRQKKQENKGLKLLKKQFSSFDTSGSFKKKSSYYSSKNQDKDSEQEQSYISISSQQSKKNLYNPKYNKKQEQKSSTTSILSSLLISQNESESQSQVEEDDDSQECSQQNDSLLNQTILQIKKQIYSKPQPKSQSEFNGYYTIKQLAQKKDFSVIFHIRVQIVKIMYFSVLNNHIPKMKFIAGDQTGYGIFFINFCPGLKAGDILDMNNCKFHQYQGSYEINNHKSFRILHSNPTGIKANLDGVSINKLLTKDLHYHAMDKRCALGIQVAQKLLQYSSTRVYRMYVQIVKVIEDMEQQALCEVADSSGRFWAILKKGRVKDFNVGDVVRLIRIKASRIKSHMVLNCVSEKALVLPHNFQFLQVSDFEIKL